MNVNGEHFDTIWVDKINESVVRIIDQRYLPFKFTIEDIVSVEQMFIAIQDMHVRGAPLIGAAGALGMYLSTLSSEAEYSQIYFDKVSAYLKSSRPTAVNLTYAVDRITELILKSGSLEEAKKASLRESLKIIEEERDFCYHIGTYGLPLIEALSKNKNGKIVNILTHCNAGWLACIDYGTATAPIYFAHDRGIKVHVWVDETRPRNQGARLTAWELGQHGVPHTVIADNTGGYLMQQGMVDMVIVGSDRTTVTGDVANKIGTYLKALAAHDNGIPFYVALPSSSIDWELTDGLKEIPIEKRDPGEVRFIEGRSDDKVLTVDILPEKSEAANYAFDVTPAKYISGLIMERGICQADRNSILGLFPEKNMQQ